VSDPFPSGKRRQRTPGYLSKTAFAAHLDISRQTLWRMVRAGRIRTVRLSPTLERISIDEIDRLNQQERERPSPRKRGKRPGAEQQNEEGEGKSE
jgi:hypothetical protein